MKKLIFRLSCLIMVTLTPMIANAQSNIKAAFDAIIDCKDADVTSSHSLEKDPETFVKNGQCDIYNFTLPEKKASLFKNLLRAFDKDSQYAYSIQSGKSKRNDRTIRVAVGDGNEAGIQVNEPGFDYIYELFLAPASENPEGIYRYAYGLMYKEIDGKIEGKFYVTYATTLKYRQKKENSSIKTRSNSTVIINGNTSWFEKLMSYLNGMSTANSRTRLSYATKAYALINNIDKYKDEVTEKDKKAAYKIIKSMRSQSKYSDPQLNAILQSCEEALQ